MQHQKLFLAAFLALTLLSTSLVSARPHTSASELTEVASELTHALESIVDRLRSETSRAGRRRRMVHLHIGRQNHHPMRSRYGRGRRLYRRQHGGRNADVSDF